MKIKIIQIFIYIISVIFRFLDLCAIIGDTNVNISINILNIALSEKCIEINIINTVIHEKIINVRKYK